MTPLLRQSLHCLVLFLLVSPSGYSQMSVAGPPWSEPLIGTTSTVYISIRADGLAGTGAALDPYDGSTKDKFDGVLKGLPDGPLTIQLGSGVFETGGCSRRTHEMSVGDRARYPRVKKDWFIKGQPGYTTTIKLAAGSVIDPVSLGYLSSGNGLGWTIIGPSYEGDGHADVDGDGELEEVDNPINTFGLEDIVLDQNGANQIAGAYVQAAMVTCKRVTYRRVRVINIVNTSGGELFILTARYLNLDAYAPVSALPIFTADSGSDTISASAHGVPDGLRIRVSSSEALPGGVAPATNYYVRDATTNTFRLSATLGGPRLTSRPLAPARIA